MVERAEKWADNIFVVVDLGSGEWRPYMNPGFLWGEMTFDPWSFLIKYLELLPI
jgi:hypothetical protein